MASWHFMVQYFEATMVGDSEAQDNFGDTRRSFLRNFFPAIVDPNRPTTANGNFGHPELINLIYIGSDEISSQNFKLKNPNTPYQNLAMLRSIAYNFCGLLEIATGSEDEQKEKVKEIVGNIFYRTETDPDRIRGPFRWHAVRIDTAAQWRIDAYENGGNGGDR